VVKLELEIMRGYNFGSLDRELSLEHLILVY